MKSYLNLQLSAILFPHVIDSNLWSKGWLGLQTYSQLYLHYKNRNVQVSKVIALLSRFSCNFNEKIKTSPESTAADLQPDPTLHHRRLRRGPPRRQQGQEQKRADRAA